jgi:hypothetical protein
VIAKNEQTENSLNDILKKLRSYVQFVSLVTIYLGENEGANHCSVKPDYLEDGELRSLYGGHNPSEHRRPRMSFMGREA